MKKLVVLSGAGMSAESGIKTFRDHDGLWEEYAVHDVATPEAWHKNPGLVLEFYNQRRRQLYLADPNAGHFALKELEKFFQVDIITQNIDDLHERAGSSCVLHLHGELKKVQSTKNPEYIILLEKKELKLGDTCPLGGQLRPHVVWFGEDVPNIYAATKIIQSADIVIIVGTSLNVYPAAGLLEYVPQKTAIYMVDPKQVNTSKRELTHINSTAAIGLPFLSKEIINLYA
jgi:NAD-dependent deacetylase